MPFVKTSSSQHAHYDAVACVLHVRNKNKAAFGILVCGNDQDDEAVELLEFNTQRWWPLPSTTNIITTETTTDTTTDTTTTTISASSSSSDDKDRPASKRFGRAVATVGPVVYVVGGQEECHSCNDVQSLEFGAKAWTRLAAKMSTGRCYPAAIGIDNSLYVLGGRQQEGWKRQQVLNSMEVLNGDSWTTKANFTIPRMAPAIVAIPTTTANSKEKESSSMIVVLGGYTGEEWTTSVEVYNVATDKWNEETFRNGSNGDDDDNNNKSSSSSIAASLEIPPLPVSLAFPKAIVIPSAPASNNDDNHNDDNKSTASFSKILVLGTTILKASGHASYTTILCYSRSTNKWTKLASGAVSRNQKGKPNSASPPSSASDALPSEGSAIVLDPESSSLYAIGGRDARLSLPASTQVLQWKFPFSDAEDIMLSKDLQSGLMMASSSSSPKRGSGAGHHHHHGRRHMANVSSSGTGSVASGVPFSTIELDEGSEAGGSVGLLSITSQHQQQQRGRIRQNRNGSTNILVQSYTSAAGGGGGGGGETQNIPEENNDDLSSVETTFVRDPMPWTDKLGVKGTYTGNVKRPPEITEPHGKGRFQCLSTGDAYDGEWRHGYRQGHGRWKYASTGDVFEGFFEKDVKQGRGTYQWRDGRQFEGRYEHDLAEDPNGTLTWKNGTLFVGAFSQGQRTGRGVIRFPNNVRYTGDFRNGKYDGYGSCTFEDGRVYTGYWKNGQAHGQGRLVEANGTVVHDGEWESDAPVLLQEDGGRASDPDFAVDERDGRPSSTHDTQNGEAAS